MDVIIATKVLVLVNKKSKGFLRENYVYRNSESFLLM
jgi:hypothetical protein